MDTQHDVQPGDEPDPRTEDDDDRLAEALDRADRLHITLDVPDDEADEAYTAAAEAYAHRRQYVRWSGQRLNRSPLRRASPAPPPADRPEPPAPDAPEAPVAPDAPDVPDAPEGPDALDDRRTTDPRGTPAVSGPPDPAPDDENAPPDRSASGATVWSVPSAGPEPGEWWGAGLMWPDRDETAPDPPMAEPGGATPLDVPALPAPPRPAGPPAPTPAASGAATPGALVPYGPADEGIPAASERGRSRWAQAVERRLLDALALGVASGAFVAPTVWLIGVAAICVVGGCVAFVLSGHPVVSLPWRAVRRGVELLHPRSLMWLPVLTARTVIGAIVLPAAVAAVVWTMAEGTTGALAAARAGAWVDGFRVGAALLCLMLVSSVGDGRQRRVTAVRRWASWLPNGAVTMLVVASVVVAAVVILAVPHPRDPIAAEADGLGWLPAAARPRADEVRDDIVTAELDVLVSCLSRRGETAWRTSYSSGNALDQPDVARLTAEGSEVGAPADLATAVMAAHNQLAPWVETIEVSWSGDGVVRTDRTALPRRRPLTDPALLVPATSAGQSWLQASVADRATVLRCSVGPVL